MKTTSTPELRELLMQSAEAIADLEARLYIMKKHQARIRSRIAMRKSRKNWEAAVDAASGKCDL